MRWNKSDGKRRVPLCVVWSNGLFNLYLSYDGPLFSPAINEMNVRDGKI